MLELHNHCTCIHSYNEGSSARHASNYKLPMNIPILKFKIRKSLCVRYKDYLCSDHIFNVLDFNSQQQYQFVNVVYILKRIM